MFFVRIVFYIKKTDSFITDSEGKIEMFKKNNATCKVQMDNRGEKNKVIVTYGGFEDKEEATIRGTNLFYSIKTTFIENHIPINISGSPLALDSKRISTPQGGFTSLEDNKHRILNEVLGMHIYEVENDISEMCFHSFELNIGTQRLMPPFNDDYKMNYQIEEAYSLLNSSALINDIRVRLLLEISALESIVSKEQKKSEECIELVGKINKFIKKDRLENEMGIEVNEKGLNKIKTHLGEFKKKSINEKCENLIERCDLNEKYLDLDPLTLFRRCYSLRSHFVHGNNYDSNEFGKYLNHLNKLILDVLKKINSNPTLLS